MIKPSEACIMDELSPDWKKAAKRNEKQIRKAEKYLDKELKKPWYNDEESLDIRIVMDHHLIDDFVCSYRREGWDIELEVLNKSKTHYELNIYHPAKDRPRKTRKDKNAT